MAQKLPNSIQSFRKIIENDLKYVDKTQYVYQLASNNGAYFISRPRRFGKSLNLSILQELFGGAKELFKGLWIENHWDWSKTFPIIKLSFTDLDHYTLDLETVLASKLLDIAKSLELVLEKVTAKERFSELISKLSVRGKVVILIDEYDAPIVDFLGSNDSLAADNQELLRNFYKTIKDHDENLRFVYVTGVSKFSKTGIFSGFNNLLDVSKNAQYASMFGYTQTELERYFVEEIDATALKLGMQRAQILAQIRLWYNGYRFNSQAETVYNPVSTNLFFENQEFSNYWFATGTPTFLVRLLQKEGLYNFSIEPQSQSSIDALELDDLNPYGILYQTGYLTIKSQDSAGLYELDYPNFEVKNAMLNQLLDLFGGVRKGSELALVMKLEKALIMDDLERAMAILQGVFKGLPYFLHEQYPEKFYHAAVHLLFTYLGIRIQSEVCTSDGRIDSLVETPSRIYIFEYKLDESAARALDQIRQKKYYQAYWHKGKKVIGVGVNFSSESKNIESWKAEEVA